MSRSKDIGTRAETAVVRVLRAHGFPQAERRALAGEYDLGDILGTPGVVWEVKGGDRARRAGDAQVAAWLGETERERVNAGADVGVLVMARAGIGESNAAYWWAVVRWPVLNREDFEHMSFPVRMHLEHACRLLRFLGYGDPLPPPAVPAQQIA